MACPFHDSDESNSDSDSETETEPKTEPTTGPGPGGGGGRGVGRRDFLRSALLIGGAGALSTATGLYGVPGSAAAEEAVGYAERLNRQHAWDDYEFEDPEKGTLPPGRHVLLHVNYRGEGEPTAADRRQADAAFRELESTIAWDHEGLLFTVGYSPAYFDRFEEPLPDGVNPDGPFEKPSLIRAQDLIDSPGVTLDHESPVADSDAGGPRYDACIHLASEHEQVLLAAEELLWGGSADIDGDGEAESLSNTLEGVFTRPTDYPARRVGFAGEDNREAVEEDADRDVYPEEVPDGAELSMGFNDLFKNSIPREDLVTLLEDQQLVEPKPPGVFAQGTVEHVSKLDLNLDPEGDDPGFEDTSAETLAEEGWYQYDDQERLERMFGPEYDTDNTGTVGEDLGSSNAPLEGVVEGQDETAVRNVKRSRERSEPADVAERTERDAEEAGVVGHVQKCARARFDMETRVTDDVPEDYPYVTERDDGFLRGHDDPQEAEQVMLRRDFNTIDAAGAARPGVHFVALMRFNPYMAYMRQAMNGVPFDSEAFGLVGDARIQHGELDLEASDNGIAGFCETKRRGNYLVPPLTQRALPHPRGEHLEVDVERAGDNYRVTVEGLAAGDLEDGSVRFGRYLEVNAAGGVEPRQTRQQGDRTTFVFPADGTGIDGETKVRLFARRAGTLRPVVGTATVGGD